MLDAYSEVGGAVRVPPTPSLPTTTFFRLALAGRSVSAPLEVCHAYEVHPIRRYNDNA